MEINELTSAERRVWQAFATGEAVDYGAGGDEDRTDWSSVALFTAALCVPPVIAVLSGRETHEVPTGRLGQRASRSASQLETVTA